MLRRVIAVFTLAAVGILGLALPAAADTGSASAYPAPAAESGYPAPPVSGSIEVLGESSSIDDPQPSAAAVGGSDASSAPSDDLAYTGVSFNVPLVVTIAAVVLLLGALLVFFGARGVARSRSRHSHS